MLALRGRSEMQISLNTSIFTFLFSLFWLRHLFWVVEFFMRFWLLFPWNAHLVQAVSVLQASLNDSHNQMVVHWAGEKSNVIVALARDSVGSAGPKTSSVSTPPPKTSTWKKTGKATLAHPWPGHSHMKCSSCRTNLNVLFQFKVQLTSCVAEGAATTHAFLEKPEAVSERSKTLPFCLDFLPFAALKIGEKKDKNTL